MRHYYNADFILTIGDIIEIKIDYTRRILNRRYHSAGHLIGDIVLKFYNIYAVKGHQFPNEAYIENSLSLEIAAQNLESHINHRLFNNNCLPNAMK